MTTFDEFAAALQEHVAEMVEDDNDIFVVDLDKDALWELYLASYPEGTNPFGTSTSTARHTPQ
jgi:hypothetical protein